MYRSGIYHNPNTGFTVEPINLGNVSDVLQALAHSVSIWTSASFYYDGSGCFRISGELIFSFQGSNDLYESACAWFFEGYPEPLAQ